MTSDAFRFHAAAYAYRKHSRTPRFPVQNSQEPPRRSRLLAGRVSPIFDAAISSALSPRRPERLRCGDVVRRRGMGRGRNGATIDPGEINRAADHRGDCEYRRGPHSRIRANPGTDRSAETETEQGIASKLRPLSDRRAEAVHRSEISDEARSRVYRARRLVARRSRDTRARTLVSQLDRKSTRLHS